jgi:GNAT superfamily N-acetyltransferase
MLPSDVDAATDLILRHEWGVRRDFLAFATSQPQCSPVVADADGEIVGTGIGTLHGAVGWIGTIFVAKAWRGRGIGRALTQEVIDRLESGGARTLVLVATADGRRLYSTMSFDVQTRYQIFTAPGLPVADRPSEAKRAEGDGAIVRPYSPADLDAVVALDGEGTGENRRHVIERFAAPETSKVHIRPDGTVDGFVIRAPWGGGATVARSIDAAAALIGERRRRSGPDGKVAVGILRDNEAGITALESWGFAPSWSAPRMIRGEAITWHPEWIWGQFNHAIG